MKFQSQLIASGSGSVGGVTFSRNKSGQYMRRRAVPINPGSAFQSLTQGNFAVLVTRWTSVLTQAQRDGWETWAINTPQFDSLGQSITITGQNAFIKMNAIYMQAEGGINDDAPALFSGTALTPPALTAADVSAQTLGFVFTDGDEWANEVGGTLLVYQGRPQNPSINFFKGPYRFCGIVSGAVIPPTSPGSVPAQFPFVIGQRIHVAFRAKTADGRISTQTRSSDMAVP
jgi:hypothetical protein